MEPQGEDSGLRDKNSGRGSRPAATRLPKARAAGASDVASCYMFMQSLAKTRAEGICTMVFAKIDEAVTEPVEARRQPIARMLKTSHCKRLCDLLIGRLQ